MVSGPGSLFIVHPRFLTDRPETLSVPFDVDDTLLERATAASAAFLASVRLMLRAEQCRYGLERKLGTRHFDAPAIRLALDALEADGLLSDERYAASWLRPRLRNGMEGPLTLLSALSRKGIPRGTGLAALARAIDEEGGREEVLLAIAGRVRSSGASDRQAGRKALLALGWKAGDIDRALDALDDTDEM
mgnify:CR=1 FL=1